MEEKDQVIKKLVSDHTMLAQRNADLEGELDNLEDELEEMKNHRDRLHKLMQRR